ncbi:MAG: hypothetical protein WCC06_03935 [Candidatus Aminicenantales bacterium]
MLKRAGRFGVEAGWIRFPADGTRIQVFDRQRNRICKLNSCNALVNTIPCELKTRGRVAHLAPTILDVSPDESAFVEEWIAGYTPPYSLDSLVEAMSKLKEYLYAVNYIDITTYRERLTSSGNMTENQKYSLDSVLNMYSGRTLPVSQVHGDLVCRNLLQHPSKGILLLDWEYTRTCLVTHDCWLYLYHTHRSIDDKQPLSSRFFVSLREVLLYLGFDSLMDNLTWNLPVIHVLHLFERQSYLRSVMPLCSIAYTNDVLERDLQYAMLTLESKGFS